MKKEPHLKAAIAGRPQFTSNYESILQDLNISPIVTLSHGELEHCDLLILPGGGDITPAFFGQKNKGSKNIDTELDILQIQALDLFVRLKRPILGICKGMQLIHVYFGGNICQHLPTASLHEYREGDQLHMTEAVSESVLGKLYGSHFIVNSAHHQGIVLPVRQLMVIQTADDGVIEGIQHTDLPIIGVQWHPERLLPPPQSPTKGGFEKSIESESQITKKAAANGRLLFQEVISWSL